MLLMNAMRVRRRRCLVYSSSTCIDALRAKAENQGKLTLNPKPRAVTGMKITDDLSWDPCGHLNEGGTWRQLTLALMLSAPDFSRSGCYC